MALLRFLFADCTDWFVLEVNCPLLHGIEVFSGISIYLDIDLYSTIAA